MLKKILRFCLFSSAGLISLSIIWSILGNLIAAQQEKKLELTKEELKKLFPVTTEPNNSALKLEELTSKLGITLSIDSTNKPARYLHISASQKTELSDEKFQEQLREYIKIQSQKTTKKIDIPPAKLQKFLKDHDSLLTEIENHILNNELPEWETDDISEISFVHTQPSLMNFSVFQYLLLLNILEKTRQGKHQEAEKSLEVSWKLNQLMVKRPYLISQLVYIITAKPQTTIMRKMPHLSPVWQTRIEQDIKYNLPQHFLDALKADSVALSNTFKTVPFSMNLGVIRNVEEDIMGKPTDVNLIILLSQLFLFRNQDYKIPTRYYLQLPYLFPNSSKDDFNYGYFIYNFAIDAIINPYLRLYAVENWKQNTQSLRKLNIYNICSMDTLELRDKYHISDEFWAMNIDYNSSFITFLSRVIKNSLDMELTQKIIHLQEISKKQGSWPKQVLGFESSLVCQDAKWIYQVDGHGNMTIELKGNFPVLSYTRDNIPLKYSAKYITK